MWLWAQQDPIVYVHGDKTVDALLDEDASKLHHGALEQEGGNF
jgi:hypothetical protein